MALLETTLLRSSAGSAGCQSSRRGNAHPSASLLKWMVYTGCCWLLLCCPAPEGLLLFGFLQLECDHQQSPSASG